MSQRRGLLSPEARFLAVLAGLGLVVYLDHRFSAVLPIAHLYYVPILIAAISFGYVGGLAAAGSAIVLFELTHAVARGQPLRFDEADVLRFALFVLVGGVTARLVQDRRRLSKMARALQTSNEELADLNRRLEVLSDARADFVAVASHELRNPLAAVLGYAQLLALPSPDPERRVQLARKLLDAGQRLRHTAENVLDVTLLESRRLALRPERIRLGGLVGGVCRFGRG